jgi:mannose-6-phosphate isomerase-like protein (cupin superfamily)
MSVHLCSVCLNELSANLCNRCGHTQIVSGDIEQITSENTAYRRVLSTTDQQQLVLMSILPSENIPLETHSNTTQFIRVESGNAIVTHGNKKVNMFPNSFILINPNTPHQVNVIGNQPLKLYTIYSPPEHPSTLVQQRQLQ